MHPESMAYDGPKIVCSYCKKVIRQGGSPDSLVSHGCCEACFAVEMLKIEEWRKQIAATRAAIKENIPDILK